MSVSDNGSLIYVPGPVTVSAIDQRDLVIVDRTGTVQTLKLPPGLYEHPRVSPNGKQVAFNTDDGKNAIVWIYDLSGTTSPRQLTFEGKNRFPVWSHDGQRVVFQSERDSEASINWQPADGATPAERLIPAESGSFPVPGSWTPDGKSFLFQKGESSSNINRTEQPRSIATLWMLSPVEKKTSPFSTQKSVTGISPIAPTVSPDGRWVAYSIGTDTTRAALQLYVQSLSTGARYSIASGAADQMWSPTSNELFFHSLVDGGTFSTRITTQPHFEFSTPTALPMGLTNVFRRSRTGPGSPRNIDIMPDGQHFIAAVRHETSSPGSQEIVVVTNWFDELTTRVRTK
jgi:serine/threonine-protein kinase